MAIHKIYSGFVPVNIDQSGSNALKSNIYSKLLKNRIIFLVGFIDEFIANLVVAQMLTLESESSDKDIYLYINSSGGDIVSGMAIYDIMQFVKPDISTLCIGQACSMASLLLSGGKNKKRYILENARVMIHQPLGEFEGQASDIKIHAKEILDVKNSLNYILSYHTGQSIKKIKKDTDRDRFMNASEAVKYGIVDSILKPKL